MGQITSIQYLKDILFENMKNRFGGNSYLGIFRDVNLKYFNLT